MAEGREDALWAGALAAALLSQSWGGPGRVAELGFSVPFISTCGRTGVFQLRRSSQLPVDAAGSPVELGEVQGAPKIRITDSHLSSAGTRRRSMEHLWAI